jgi:hypothetical protein
MPQTFRRSHARILGALYLLYFVTAVSGELLVKGLAVHGDAAATARNFAAHQFAVKASSALGLISIVEYLALTALFYALFQFVSHRLSLLSTLLSVTACATQALSNVFLVPLLGLVTVHDGSWTEGRVRLAQALLEMHAQILSISLILFGVFDVLIGVLIFRSGFLPRLLGILMMIAGLGWFVYLWPPVSPALARVIQPVGFLAEAILMIWLLVKGVDEERWRLLHFAQG